jgi:hypothetical protein
MTVTPSPHLDIEATEEFAQWAREQQTATDDPFAVARRIVPRLGAQPIEPGLHDGQVTFGFWVPRLVREHVADADLFLEVLDPVDHLDVTVARSTVTFRRTLISVRRDDALVVAVADGIRIGDRDHLGSFYCLTYRDGDGAWQRVYDPMATSLPFGAVAPAEVYDGAGLETRRSDRSYWQALAQESGHDRCGEGIIKRSPAVNILQVHVPTATAGGTLASLTAWFERLADRVRDDADLTPQEQAYLGYDAVQLLPVEPTTVYEAGPPFWDPHPTPQTPGDTSDDDGSQVTVTVRRPDTTNWGYDIVIAGSAAVNPTLLETGRPDELVDLAGALHGFPSGPINLIADVVYGHADNQAIHVLDDEWFAGPNMYGQNLDYRNPWVRAILLEMQRRKINFGFDAVRVDGAQDVK